MDEPRILFFYDLADPLSYATELELRALGALSDGTVERVPFELRPPPLPLLDSAAAEWQDRLDRARDAVAAAAEVTAPRLLPWTRKAHELVLHARASGREADVVVALYRALLEEERDVGRVDVLVEIAAAHGLDRTGTKAVLDVDRYAASVAEGRERAVLAAVVDPPALVGEGATLRGFHSRDALGTFLQSMRA